MEDFTFAIEKYNTLISLSGKSLIFAILVTILRFIKEIPKIYKEYLEAESIKLDNIKKKIDIENYKNEIDGTDKKDNVQ